MDGGTDPIVDQLRVFVGRVRVPNLKSHISSKEYLERGGGLRMSDGKIELDHIFWKKGLWVTDLINDRVGTRDRTLLEECLADTVRYWY